MDLTHEQWAVMEAILQELVHDLTDRGDVNLSECFIEGNFVVANKGVRGGKDQAG